jgi:hypothetical protein
MRRPALFVALLTLTSLAWAQQQTPPQQQQQAPYQPAVPPPSMGMYGGGGWGMYGGAGGVGSTAAGSAMTGMANVISAKGDYNLSTSAAAVNYTQAQKNEIQNRQLYTDTYFNMRATNKAARAAEDGPPPTAEQIARIAHDGAPRPLSTSEVNGVTGRLNWPSALQMDSFAPARQQLEPLFVSLSQLGTLNYADQSKAREIINGMNSQLKSMVRMIPPSDYTACKSFLKSLMFTACKSQLS